MKNIETGKKEVESENREMTTETESLHVIIKTPLEGYPLKGSFPQLPALHS